MEGPNRIGNIDSISNRVGERTAFRDGRCDGGFEEVHGECRQRCKLAELEMRCPSSEGNRRTVKPKRTRRRLLEVARVIELDKKKMLADPLSLSFPGVV